MTVCSGCSGGWCAGCVPVDPLPVTCPHCLKPLEDGQEVEYEPYFASVLHRTCSHIWNEYQMHRIEVERQAEAVWSQEAR